MSTFWLSALFFSVGFIEFAVDQWEKLVSSRLKFLPTLLFSAVNQSFDLILILFFFNIIDAFITKWHHGIHDYFTLIPYLAYMLGRVWGTSGSVFLYTWLKKRKDHEKAVKYLEKKKVKRVKKGSKKKVEDLQHNPNTMLDPVEVEDVKNEIKERAIETATQQITERINEAFNGEESK